MKSKRGNVLVIVGVALILSAMALTGYNLYDDRQAQVTCERVVASLLEEIPTLPSEPDLTDGPITSETEIPDHILAPMMEMPEMTVDGQGYIGVLAFGDFGLQVPVMSMWSYPKLKQAPCRYSGSVYTDDLIVAAHNYRSHFGDIQYLHPGSTVTFTDVDGHVFTYRVVEKEMLLPTAVEDMKAGEWDLTLFTCTLGGSSRVTVRCERIGQ